jgi:hypothetical protein
MQARRQPEEVGQKVKPLIASQAEIEKRHVELVVARHRPRVGGVGRLHRMVVHGLQRDAQRLPEAGFVIDNEDIHGAW